MASLYGTQFTDQWLANPWSTEPSQMQNPYTQYPGALPFPPTYNEGLAGGPVNAATGQPIQSYQAWKAANPAGMTINNTPAQPQPMAQPQQMMPTPTTANTYTGGANNTGGYGAGIQPQNYQQMMQGAPMVGTGAAQQQAQPQPAAPSGPPNNWQAAINALAQPGRVTTPGATVPQATGSQPSGGVNAAWLKQIGAGQGMNQNFIGALRGIQGR
jgi:hypothetical protein